MNIVMVAAENDALPGGKVGGVGDVVRDVPVALAARGHTVSVITPAYGVFASLPGAVFRCAIEFAFGGRRETVRVFAVPARTAVAGVAHYALEHPLFASCGAGRIYCDDGPGRPFASDASKFALFCGAVAHGLAAQHWGAVDVVHLHDWHAAMVAILRAYAPDCAVLRAVPMVFSVHNLALQGIRPLAGDPSALRTWYPSLSVRLGDVGDPRYPECLNLMRAGINLSDRIHLVSPSYAQEVLRPSDPALGFFGGEGLEPDLQQAAAAGRLVGILNGADYTVALPPRLTATALWTLCETEILSWLGRDAVAASAHVIALQRLRAWRDRARRQPPRKAAGPPALLLTSVGRLTDQKVLLLRQRLPDGRSVLEALLQQLGPRDRLVMLGSGDADWERFMLGAASAHDGLLFLQGYSETVAQHLYRCGDLFLMPSSFEPCGISQMLAMRAGQPCLVHAVGGLADTVRDGENGFVFAGTDLTAQGQALVRRLGQVLRLARRDPARWQAIGAAAAAARFPWSDAALAYEQLLYAPAASPLDGAVS
jgi:starch synthase